MFRQLKKNLVVIFIVVMIIGQVVLVFVDSVDILLDMGIFVGSMFFIGQEMQMGDYYVRQLCGSVLLINDLLLM